MKVFVCDLSKCNGCHNCQIACKDEHVENDWSPIAKPQPDTGQFWCRVDEEVCGSVPHVRVNYIPHLCNHCADAPCMAAAPDAVYRRDDGLVIIDPEKASGTRELVDSCPYGAIYYNDELQIPQKCTGCAHLLDDGWSVPRCVDACATGALRFGELSDFAGELDAAQVLHPEFETSPQAYYLNMPKRFIAATVVDIEADEVVQDARATLQDIETEEFIASAQTDEFGDICFEHLEAKPYRLWIQKEGYLDQYRDLDVTEKDQTVAELRFYRTAVAG